MVNNPTVDVIIPSFNGRYLLEKYLPEIIKNTDNLNKIIVIDNGSSDGTVSWLKENYQKIKIVENKTNLFFTKPINQGVAVSDSDFFILLNNDVRPEKGYLKDTLKYFKDDKVFAVSFNEASSSWPNLSWSQGKIQYTQAVDKTRPYYSAWASGGSAVFRRKTWDRVVVLTKFTPLFTGKILISAIGLGKWVTKLFGTTNLLSTTSTNLLVKN